MRRHRMRGYGQILRLTPEQQEHLVQEVATGRFPNATAIRTRVAEMFAVIYTEGGMYRLLERLRCRPKVPRPLHGKLNLAKPEAWTRGDLPTR